MANFLSGKEIKFGDPPSTNAGVSANIVDYSKCGHGPWVITDIPRPLNFGSQLTPLVSFLGPPTDRIAVYLSEIQPKDPGLSFDANQVLVAGASAFVFDLAAVPSLDTCEDVQITNYDIKKSGITQQMCQTGFFFTEVKGRMVTRWNIYAVTSVSPAGPVIREATMVQLRVILALTGTGRTVVES